MRFHLPKETALQKTYRFGAALALALLVSTCPAARAQKTAAPIAGTRSEMPESVADAVSRATRIKHLDPQQKLDIIVAFHFRDPKAAQAYADAVSDPNSPLFRQFLTPQEIGERFGPNPADYQAVKNYLQANGLRIAQEYPNKMTVDVEGTVTQMETAFSTQINLYRESRRDFLRRPAHGAEPLVFRANATPIRVPAELGPALSGVVNVSDYMRPIPRFQKRRKTTGDLTPIEARGGYDVSALYSLGDTGTGRTVGISNFVAQNHTLNAPKFIATFGLPSPAAGAGSNISVTTVSGGNGTGNGVEGDLDYQMVLGMAPLATIIIYDTGESNLLGCLEKEVSDNLADVLTESYGWKISGSSATSYHNEHTMMTMQGQTYSAASGDSGSSISPYFYPDIDPEVLMVGGTILTVNISNVWSSEIAWGGVSGGTVFGSGGGYDNTGTYAQPAYQVGRGISATLGGRAFPDIALNAAGANTNDPGAFLFYSDGTEGAVSGTSCASPTNAGALAVTEQYLIALGDLPANSAGKQRLGRLQDALYAFNGRSDVFHDITSGSNGTYSCTPYWDEVTGWGSLNYYNLGAALANPLAVNVTPVNPTIHYGQTQQCAATVTGSNVQTVKWSLVSGPTGSSVSSAGLFTAPATGTVTTTAVVQAAWSGDYAAPGAATGGTYTLVGTTTIAITPLSASYAVSGTITLQSAVNEAQQVTFNFVPTAGSTITQNVTLSATGAYSLSGIPNGTYAVKVAGSKWLQTDVTGVVVNGAAVTGVNATLIPGDLNGDNIINLSDFNLFVPSFGLSSGDAGFNAAADLNCDGQVDLNDFNILAANFGLSGDP